MSNAITTAIVLAAAVGAIHIVVSLLWYRSNARRGPGGLHRWLERRLHVVWGTFRVTEQPYADMWIFVHGPGWGQNVWTVSVRSRGFYFGREKWIYGR